MIEESCDQSTERTEAILRLREAFFWSWLALDQSAEDGARPFEVLPGGKGLESLREKGTASEPTPREPPPGA
jgi:hypothetical protein